ncbi:MAG: hypothetical protein ACRENP_19370 [Longimicrobiales bacterium]
MSVLGIRVLIGRKPGQSRAFKADPVGTSLRATSMITVPSVIEYLVYLDDPEYFEIPQWQRDLFWVFKVGDA